jgi:simple sugar transport system permease protein
VTKHLARDLGLALLAVAAALFVGSLFVWAVGDSPVFFFALVVESAFGSLEGIAYTLFYATPMICTGLAVAVAYRCGLLNIGAEGQMVVGALAAAAAALSLPVSESGETTSLAVVVGVLAGLAAGAVWGGVPGYLRARFGAHEVIVTIMMNAIAFALASYATIAWLRAPGDQNLESRMVAEGAPLPRLGALGNPKPWESASFCGARGGGSSCVRSVSTRQPHVSRA